MKRSKAILEMARAEGWRPGLDVRKTRTFEHISELCGCDSQGNAIRDAKRELKLGETADAYSIRDLFETLVVNKSDGQSVGSSFVEEFFNPRHPRSIFETGGFDAVDTTLFTGITGQLMVTQVLEPYNKEEYIFRKMFPTYSSPLEQEKWIGIAPPKDPADDMLVTPEGGELKYGTMGEEYVQTPMTKKRMFGIGLTKEAIFFDRTGQLSERANQVGDLLAFSEEKECIHCLIGTSTQFVEKRMIDSAPVTLDLYQEASAGSGAGQLAFAYSSRPYPFVNDVPSNPLEDYKSIRTADQYFSAVVDPNRGRPVVIGKPYVVAPHTKRLDIMHMLEAENIWLMSRGGLSTSLGVNTVGPNVLSKIGLTADQFVVSRLLKAELVSQLSLTSSQADLVWFYGDIGAAFRYVENWPLTVVAAPVNSEAEFSQDIVLRWKASKRGVAAIKDPRQMQRHNKLSQSSGT